MAAMPKIKTVAKRSLVLSLFVCWVTSCGSQNFQKTAAPFEPELPFKPVKTADNKSHPGYGLYVKHCYQCHQQAHPASLSIEKWGNTVPRMTKHAGISQADGKQILDYILQLKAQS